MTVAEYKALFEKRKRELEIRLGALPIGVYEAHQAEESLLLVNFWLAAIAELERLDRG